MPGLHTIVYVSHAVGDLSVAELERILEVSRRNNARDGITGALLHLDGDFMQCLEGEETMVREAYARIEHDPRHAGAIVLLDEPITGRAFPTWSMAHLRPTRSELLALSTADWRERVAHEPGTPSRGLVALKSFAARYQR